MRFSLLKFIIQYTNVNLSKFKMQFHSSNFLLMLLTILWRDNSFPPASELTFANDHLATVRTDIGAGVMGPLNMVGKVFAWNLL